jgi:hypothetical protein
MEPLLASPDRCVHTRDIVTTISSTPGALVSAGRRRAIAIFVSGYVTPVFIVGLRGDLLIEVG